MLFNEYDCNVQNMNGVGENAGITEGMATRLGLQFQENKIKYTFSTNYNYEP